MNPQRPYPRQDRMIAQIMPVVASFIRSEANTTPLITVTNISLSPDYRKMTVFITTIPDDRQDDALIFLKRKASALREYLKQHSRLKIIPHIDFSIDYNERHRQHVDELLREIGNE